MAATMDSVRHILVIDDSPDILTMFTDLLTDEGYRVTTDSFTAEIGLLHDHIRRVDPDLIILDMIIGREDLGWQLIQLLKMSAQTARIPLILCTGAIRQVEELAPHLDDLAIGVVLKPFELDRLLEAIDQTWKQVPNPSSSGVAGPKTGDI